MHLNGSQTECNYRLLLQSVCIYVEKKRQGKDLLRPSIDKLYLICPCRLYIYALKVVSGVSSVLYVQFLRMIDRKNERSHPTELQMGICLNIKWDDRSQWRILCYRCIIHYYWF